MTEQLPELWAGVDVFSTTTDCAAQMVKTGRLLKDGKVADNDGPALPALNIVWNGCAAHRLDKMYVLISKHPELEGLMNKLTAITTHVNKSSQALDHARKCGELVGVAWTSLKSMGKTRWWSFFTMFESFMLNIKTLRYQRDSPHSDLVAPEVYNLSDLDWADDVIQVGARDSGG